MPKILLIVVGLQLPAQVAQICPGLFARVRQEHDVRLPSLGVSLPRRLREALAQSFGVSPRRAYNFRSAASAPQETYPHSALPPTPPASAGLTPLRLSPHTVPAPSP